MNSVNEPASLSVEEALSALDFPPATHRPALGYRVSLAAVAVVMVLLPVLYVALLGAVGYGGYWWVEHGGDYVSLRGGGASVRVLARFGPVLIAAVMALFMLKPLLARSERRTRPAGLRPEDEPVLHAFVKGLAERMGAPVPSSIQVDLAVNASAGFRGGVGSLFSNDLVLTLGLPLVGCMSARQLTSVIAHEFGHFSQGAGMRSYFLVSTVNHWFARVVHERDSWDRWLEEAPNRVGRFSGWTSILLLVAQAAVWLTRKILSGLMLFGHAVSSTLSRQMEFDADRHAVRVAGGEVFEASMCMLPLIDAADSNALHDVNTGWREGRLGDDYIVLVRKNLAQFDAKVREEIVTHAMQRTPGMYASHPPTGQRIRRAKEIGAPCGVVLEGPATGLFADFDATSRRETVKLYETCLGERFDAAALVSSEQVAADGERRMRALRDAERLLRGNWAPPLLLPDDGGTEASPGAMDAVEALRAAAREHSADHDALDETMASIGEQDGKLRLRLTGHLLREGKLKVKLADFDLKSGSAMLSSADRLADAGAVYERLAPHADRLWRRIRCAEKILSDPARGADIPEAGVLADNMACGLGVLETLAPCALDVLELWRTHDVMDRTGEALSKMMNDEPKAHEQLRWADEAVRTPLQNIIETLGDAPYPFDHAREDLTLADFVLPEPLEPGARSSYAAGETAITGLFEVYRRGMGRIARACMGVEEALGIESAGEEAEPSSVAA